MKILKLNSLNLSLPKITAGSALINIKDRHFLCSDDQYDLYELKNNQWIIHHWSEAPVLPVENPELKKRKPDYESLLQINDHQIMLFPSGSKDNRTLGLIFDLNTNQFSPYDLKPFFQKLSLQFPQINIEGALLFGEVLLLMNRGVNDSPSSIITVDKNSWDILKSTQINFGKLKGVPLHGSEISFFDNCIYALAVAEDASNSYDDGAIIGSSLCKISLKDFSIIDQWQFDLAIKAEGLCRYQNHWLITTDPDGAGISEFYTFST